MQCPPYCFAAVWSPLLPTHHIQPKAEFLARLDKRIVVKSIVEYVIHDSVNF